MITGKRVEDAIQLIEDNFPKFYQVYSFSFT
jgi:hypothetical protein